MRFFSFFLLGLLLLSSCSLHRTPVIIQFDRSCAWEDLLPREPKLHIETEKYVIVGLPLLPSEKEALVDNPCVIRTAERGELPTLLEKMQQDLDAERDEKIQRANLQRTLVHRDLLDQGELQSVVDEQNPEESWPGGVISAYQLYVTPDAEAVQEVAQEKSGIEEIYPVALDWVWISDSDLNGVEEKWLYPEEFLRDTPDYPMNPTGDVASDCEEQANTLASVLIADGYDSEDVRVVLGIVNFEGVVGGHAWVEVYEDGRWFPIEATAGDYYDTTDGLVKVGTIIPYDYFRYHRYPVLKVWYYYNNDYFLDVTSGEGNAPSHWEEASESWLEGDLRGFQGDESSIFKR